MHIIFGTPENLPDNYTVLELDTFRFTATGQTATAYAVVEQVPLVEFAVLQQMKTVHSDLIKYYRQQQWTYCEHAIDYLVGKWNGEIDTFYQELLARIQQHKSTTLPDDWDGCLEK